MTEEELNQIIQTVIDNLDNQGVVTEQLDKLRTGVSSVITSSNTLKEDLQKKDEQIGKLKETNMNLFLKTGQQVNQDTISKTDPDPLKYEDLIKDMEVN